MQDKEFVVEKLVHGGMGIVRDGSHTIFTPFAIPGEIVNIRIEPGTRKPTRARITEIVKASPYRVAPPCELFGECGGCQLQHIEYPAQIGYKRDIVIETMARIAGTAGDIDPIVPSDKSYNYRSRIRLHAIHGALGFFAEKKRKFLEVKYCRLAEEKINDALPSMKKLAANKSPGAVSISIEEDESLTAVFEGAIGDRIYRKNNSGEWSPAPKHRVAFQQVNRRQNEILRKIVGDAVREIRPEGIIELYAGSGNFTEILIPHCDWVAAADSDSNAVIIATDKFRDKVEFHRSESAAFVEEAIDRGLKPTLVLLDPPRIGAREALPGIIKLSPKFIIYISCNPATLARDINTLIEASYNLKSITPIDMFPQTSHIECFVSMARNE